MRQEQRKRLKPGEAVGAVRRKAKKPERLAFLEPALLPVLWMRRVPERRRNLPGPEEDDYPRSWKGKRTTFLEMRDRSLTAYASGVRKEGLDSQHIRTRKEGLERKEPLCHHRKELRIVHTPGYPAVVTMPENA